MVWLPLRVSSGCCLCSRNLLRWSFWTSISIKNTPSQMKREDGSYKLTNASKDLMSVYPSANLMSQDYWIVTVPQSYGLLKLFYKQYNMMHYQDGMLHVKSPSSHKNRVISSKWSSSDPQYQTKNLSCKAWENIEQNRRVYLADR